MRKIICLVLLLCFSITAAAAPPLKLRKFYLTPTTVQGNGALTACADGFHMASIFEIFDVSNLRYDTTLGKTDDDSGSGPPSEVGINSTGWVRTGRDSENDDMVPGDNCLVWSVTTGRGTRAQLVLDDASATFGMWEMDTTTCVSSVPVWCVQD